MLTLSWAPSASPRWTGCGAGGGQQPVEDGGRAGQRRSVAEAPGRATVPGDHAVGVDRQHPAVGAHLGAGRTTAARARASVTAPMPPTGTSQSPVPPPIEVVEEADVLAQVGLAGRRRCR